MSQPTPPPDRRSGASAPGGGPISSPGIDSTTCPHCGESRELAKVKGCIRCLRCGFKFDCNGW